MSVTFQKATRHQARLRMALLGPSGSGKTYSALAIGTALGQRVAVIDTERGSASKYAGDPFNFDVLELQAFDPRRYVEAIKAAADAGYDVLVIDSLSHAWMGKGGALELKDQATRQGSGNSFDAWRTVTPIHNQLVDAMLAAPLHIIATMRVKTEYVQERDERGKTQIRKVGLQPVQRDGLEYEFDVVGDLDPDNTLVITKTRCSALAQAVIAKPGATLATTLREWLSVGAPAPAPAADATTEWLPAPPLTTNRANGHTDTPSAGAPKGAAPAKSSQQSATAVAERPQQSFTEIVTRDLGVLPDDLEELLGLPAGKYAKEHNLTPTVLLQRLRGYVVDGQRFEPMTPEWGEVQFWHRCGDVGWDQESVTETLGMTANAYAVREGMDWRRIWLTVRAARELGVAVPHSATLPVLTEGAAAMPDDALPF